MIADDKYKCFWSQFKFYFSLLRWNITGLNEVFSYYESYSDKALYFFILSSSHLFSKACNTFSDSIQWVCGLLFSSASIRLAEQLLRSSKLIMTILITWFHHLSKWICSRSDFVIKSMQLETQDLINAIIFFLCLNILGTFNWILLFSARWYFLWDSWLVILEVRMFFELVSA